MAKFNAGTAVESMEYDFTDFGGGKGKIPEPTSKAVENFFATVKNLAAEIKGKMGNDSGEMSDAEAADAITEVDENLISEYEEELASAISELCQNTPSFDEIYALPFRVRTAFMSWLVGELRPEPQRPATRR